MLWLDSAPHHELHTPTYAPFEYHDDSFVCTIHYAHVRIQRSGQLLVIAQPSGLTQVQVSAKRLARHELSSRIKTGYVDSLIDSGIKHTNTYTSFLIVRGILFFTSKVGASAASNAGQILCPPKILSQLLSNFLCDNCA